VSDAWHIRREKATTYCLYAAVATMPFSIALCHFALIAFLVSGLFEKNLIEKLRATKTNYQLLALAAFAGILLCGISYSENKNDAWFAMEKKVFFFILPFAFATSSIVSSKLLKNLFSIFCFSCFVALIVCYILAFQRMQLFHDGKIGIDSINYLSSPDFWQANETARKEWMFFSYVGLSNGVNMHPTYLSMYSAFCCIVLVQRTFDNSQKPLSQISNFLLIAFFSASIIFLAARIVLLMLGVLYVGILCYQLVLLKTKTKPAFILFSLIALLIAGVLINPVTRYRQVDEIVTNGLSVTPNKNYDNSTGIRVSLWWVSAQAYLNSNLLFGTGTGDVEESVRKMADHFAITNILNSYNPHNEYLHVLLSTGAVGLSFLLIYIGAGLVKAWQNRDIIFLNFLLLFMIVCLTESVLELQKGIVFFSIFFPCMSFQKKVYADDSTTLNIASAAN
jgi:hypothetical protein